MIASPYYRRGCVRFRRDRSLSASFRPIAFAVLVGFFLVADVCRADDAIPANLKTGVDPGTGQAQVAQFLGATMPQLLNDSDPAAQSAARESLIKEVLVNGAASASAAYLETYAKQLNDQVVKALNAPSTSVRAKVNLAIITAKVAAVANNVSLSDATIALLSQQKLMPLQLWGLRAAQSIVFAALGNPAYNPQSLMNAIVNVVTADSPPVMVESAYSAVIAGWPGKNLQPGDFATLAPFVQKLLERRVNIYVQTDPSDPDADSVAVLFLGSTIPNGAAIVPSVKTTLQDIANLISVAGQHGPKSQNSTQYVYLLQGVYKALQGSMLETDAAPLQNVFNNFPAATQASDAIVKHNGLSPTPVVHDVQVHADTDSQ